MERLEVIYVVIVMTMSYETLVAFDIHVELGEGLMKHTHRCGT